MLPANAALPEQLPVCPEHPERPSLASCERCGRFLCEACAFTREPPRCADCHARVEDPWGILSQPFSVGRSFANGWTLFQEALPSILPIALVVGVSGGLLNYFVDSSPMSEEQGLLIGVLFECTVALLAMGSYFALLVGIAEGRRVRLPQALRQGLSAMPGLFGAIFLQYLSFFLYSLLLIVPGIIKGVSLSLAAESAFREPGRNALKNSERLVIGRRWEAFGLVVALYAIAFAIYFGLDFFESSFSDRIPSARPFMAILLEAGMRFGDAFIKAVGLASFYGFKRLRGEPLAPR